MTAAEWNEAVDELMESSIRIAVEMGVANPQINVELLYDSNSRIFKITYHRLSGCNALCISIDRDEPDEESLRAVSRFVEDYFLPMGLESIPANFMAGRLEFDVAQYGVTKWLELDGVNLKWFITNPDVDPSEEAWFNAFYNDQLHTVQT